MLRCLLRSLVGMLACCGAIFCALPATAQSTSATVSGIIVDETGAAVPNVLVTIINVGTRLQRETKTTKEGQFTIPLLPPGRYTLTATREGFTPLEARDVVLTVNDQVSLTLKLKVAGLGEELTVVGETRRTNTSPTVGTVVDRQFVENMPLSGRSFQALLELTPGVVLTRAGTAGAAGQFSVNGQRANSNYFTIDGVSGNGGTTSTSTGFPGQAGSGQLPAMTALGGTNGLVSVDALQEFRIQTSTYAAEFGRMPGGQVSLVTRSGSNRFTGSVFEYFRDERFDANDWFTNRLGAPKPDLTQHSFGGVLGGPLLTPKSFFFVSYEGLRLKQPQSRTALVPSMATREAAPAALRPYVDVFPIPNGANVDGGMANLLASYSDDSKFDSSSVRFDHQAASGLSLFGRVAFTPSYTKTRGFSLSDITTSTRETMSGMVGATWVISRRMVHEVRANYLNNDAPYSVEPGGFGGASLPPAEVFVHGRGPESALYSFGVGIAGWTWGTGTNYVQRQMNIVDSLTVMTAKHDLKFGLDYLRTMPLLSGRGGRGIQLLTFSPSGLATGRANSYLTFESGSERLVALFSSLSLYAQDNWRLSPRLTVNGGLRWEYVPPARASEGPNAATLNNIDDPFGGAVSIAEPNTPLWRTRYNNFAPRMGASFVLSDKPGNQTVVRGGFGTFYDLGFGHVATAFRTYPLASQRVVSSPTFPLSPDVLALPQPSEPPPSLWLMDPDLKLPYTFQWNASLERALGANQGVTVTYVGAAGRRLLKLDRYRIRLVEWPTVPVQTNVNRNNGYSDYRALQVQFQRRLHDGLQALVSYTWGRSRDTSSSDSATTSIPAERLPPSVDYGYSDFDVRHVLNAAVTYQIPGLRRPSIWGKLTRNWAADLLVRAHSAYPITVFTSVPFPPDTETARADLVPNQPVWLEDTTAPGGRRLNGLAFSRPEPNTQGNQPRNGIRGFTARQVDAALRRQFAVSSTLRLQLRFEMFNLFNTPNFADPTGVQLGSIASGTSTQTLSRGLGGLNALYQIGGPRSSQFAIKLMF